MFRSPRIRQLVLLVGVLSLLLGPTTTPSRAQVLDDTLTDGTGWRFDAQVNGATDPTVFPQDHTLGLNRVTGPSTFMQFGILAAIACRTGDGRVEVVVANLAQNVIGNHRVDFWANDDLTDGFGEVSPTDTDRRFSSTFGLFGEEFRVPDLPGSTELPEPPVASTVDVRIVSGRFHRILNVVDVTLQLDVRVERSDEGLICETRSSNYLRIRIFFLIVGPGPNGSGFSLVGTAHREGSVSAVPPLRDLCNGDPFGNLIRFLNDVVLMGNRQALRPVGIEITDSHRLDLGFFGQAIGRPGRGSFHPCPPEGQRGDRSGDEGGRNW